MGIADDIGGYDPVGIIAVILAVFVCFLELCVDLICGSALFKFNSQLRYGTVRDLHALGMPLEFAVNRRYYLADSLCSTGAVRNGIHGSSAVVALLGITRAVKDHLCAGIGVDSSHEADLHTPVVVKRLDHGCQGVCSAGACRHDAV